MHHNRSAHLCSCHITCRFYPIALLELSFLCAPLILDIIGHNGYHDTERIARIIASIVQTLSSQFLSIKSYFLLHPSEKDSNEQRKYSNHPA